MEMKDYNLTCGEVIDNLLTLADAYEKASAGKAPNGFAFNPTDAAASMKAAVAFIGIFGQQMPRWIPVEERLPEEGQNVLAYSKRMHNGVSPGSVCVFKACTFYGLDWLGIVTASHWMPLPEPPISQSIEERIRDHVCDTLGIERGQVAEPASEEVVGLFPIPEPPEVK